jgi:hypothetical protein
MTLAVYSNPQTTASPRCRVTGTRHDGPAWTAAVRVLRAAVVNAVGHAGVRRSATSKSTDVDVTDVGVDIIDNIALLDTKSLHVLSVVFGMLLRASRQD